MYVHILPNPLEKVWTKHTVPLVSRPASSSCWGCRECGPKGNLCLVPLITQMGETSQLSHSGPLWLVRNCSAMLGKRTLGSVRCVVTKGSVTQGRPLDLLSGVSCAETQHFNRGSLSPPLQDCLGHLQSLDLGCSSQAEESR